MITPPDDWDYTIRGLRCAPDPNRPFADMRRQVFGGVVKIECSQAGVWSTLFEAPLTDIPCRGLAMHPGIADAHASFQPSAWPGPDGQPICADRTRVWFPEPGYFMVDVTARGDDIMFPLWFRKSGTILSTCLGRPPTP